MRPSSEPPPNVEELLLFVADVLLAAAHADGTMCGRELRSVTRILLRLTDAGELSPALRERVDTFDPATFDLLETAERLARDPLAQRRHVLELVREVRDANNAFDLQEEQFLIGLTCALELSPEDIADLVVHAQDGIYGSVKRVFDFLLASAFLLGAWLLLLVIALGVKVSSPGPPFSWQRRLGRHGNTIEVLSFAP